MASRFTIAAGIVLALAFAGEAQAQRAMNVVGVAPNDVLNVREFPSTASRIVGVIPPDAKGLAPTGDRKGAWIFVSWRRVEGWVDTRYVAPEAPRLRRGRSYDDDMTE